MYLFHVLTATDAMRVFQSGRTLPIINKSSLWVHLTIHMQSCCHATATIAITMLLVLLLLLLLLLLMMMMEISRAFLSSVLPTRLT